MKIMTEKEQIEMELTDMREQIIQLNTKVFKLEHTLSTLLSQIRQACDDNQPNL